MADKVPFQSEKEGQGTAGFNSFSNDGSFMEQFMKIQQGKKDEAAAEKPTSGVVSMKMTSVKKIKPAVQVQKKIQSQAARKAFGEELDNEDEGRTETSNARNETERREIATPTSYTTGLTTSKQSLAAMSGPSTSSTGSRKRRRSKWDVPSTGSSTGNSESDAINEAIRSFSESASSAHSSSGQQLTLAQMEQMQEQIRMNRLVSEIKAATQPKAGRKNKSKYEYDSDEDIEGGTWEHKARVKEMRQTEEQSSKLTEAGKGKHHISDFLPPEELEKFVETVKAVKEDRPPDFSDYKEHKLTEENIGFKMLQKAGWTEGAGLGSQEQGRTAPINKGKQSFDQSGVGAVKPAEVKKEDDEFELYRKRMMLAYRFRPNPLNNPRRPYY